MTSTAPRPDRLRPGQRPRAVLMDAELPVPSASPWWEVLAILGAAVLLGPMLGYSLAYDQGILAYSARTLLAGHWLYSDAFDTSFPGGVLIHALPMAVAGNAVLAFRLEDLIAQLLAAAALFVAGRRLAGSLGGVYAAWSYACLYVTGGYRYTGDGDGFMVPLLLLALISLWEYWSNPSRRRWIWIAAVSLGLACTIRPTYAVLALVATCALALRRASPAATARDQRLADLRTALLFAVVSALPLLVFLAAYVLTGRSRAIVDLLTYIGTVSPWVERVPRADVLVGFVTFARRTMWIGALLAILSPAWRIRRLEMLSLLGYMISVVGVRLWEANGYLAHYWPFFPAVALLAAAGWVWLGNRIVVWTHLTGRRALAVRAAVVAGVLVGQIGLTRVSAYDGFAGAVRQTASDTAIRAVIGVDPRHAELARYLRDHSTPADSIQLWGPEVSVLVAAERWSATRFPDASPLFCPSGKGLNLASACGPSWPRPIQVRIRQEIVSTLNAHPPLYIVAHYANGTVGFVAGPESAPDLPELRALIDAKYQVDTTFGDWTAYRRRGS